MPLGQLVRDRLARRDLGIVDHDLGAVVAGGGQLLRRRVLRHDDGGVHAEDLAHERQRLGMVARRVGDDAGRALAPSLSRLTALNAPRNLNAPMRCKFSHLRNMRLPHAISSSREVATGVRCAAPAIRSAAEAMSL